MSAEAADSDWLARLREVVGEGSLAKPAGIVLDQVEPEVRFEPRNGQELADALKLLSALGRSALIQGGGTHLAAGNPLRSADLLLSTTSLCEIDTFDVEDGVVHAGGGTPLSSLRARAWAEGWEVPLDPPGEGTEEGAGSTLGGVIASAAVGPRQLGFGAPRDCVLGLDVVLASGERTRCGGRVVKNVTGYDLAKLYTGSFGTLGVIEGVWLRLKPQPERVQQFVLQGDELGEALRLGVELSRRYTTRAATLLDAQLAQRMKPGAAARWTLVAELAGDAPAVDRDAAWLAERAKSRASLAAVAAGEDPLAGVRALQGQTASEGLRARIAVLPSRLGPVCERLRALGAQLLVQPGLGLVYAHFELAAGEVGAVLRGVDDVVAGASGSLLLEALPQWAKPGRDVFAVDAASLSLMRSLKQRFDPGGVLNPGRFAGGI